METTAYMLGTTNINTQLNSHQNVFLHYLFGKRKNKILILVALFGGLMQLIIFKLLYPFPDFISDSYSYIATNVYQMKVNLWPIGYSKFIWFIHLINTSDNVLIAVQYFILEISFLYFFFSIDYLYKPTRGISIIIYLFLFFNPIFLYLSNCVLSDSLFTALTVIFVCQFFWMFYHPTITQVIIQGVIIGLAFTIRYTAIYYPLASLMGLLLSNHRPSVKIWGFSIGIVIISAFVSYTKQMTKEATGTAQFSVFGGWQIANNALYMYNYIKVDTNRLPPETRALDRLSRQFFEKSAPTKQDLAAMPGTYFIKVPWAILKPYMAYRYPYSDPPLEFKSWAKVSPVYERYGQHLITNYPIAFTKHYLGPNLKNYFLPHLEKFETYNLGINTVPSDVQDWFGYITPDIYAFSSTFQGKLFYICPALFFLLNLYFFLTLIWLLINKKFNKLLTHVKKCIYFTTAFLIINLGFSVFATPIVLRYEIVPLILLFTFCLLLPNPFDNKSTTN